MSEPLKKKVLYSNEYLEKMGYRGVQTPKSEKIASHFKHLWNISIGRSTVGKIWKENEKN
jgi:hypothetical protein